MIPLRSICRLSRSVFTLATAFQSETVNDTYWPFGNDHPYSLVNYPSYHFGLCRTSLPCWKLRFADSHHPNFAEMLATTMTELIFTAEYRYDEFSDVLEENLRIMGDLANYDDDVLATVFDDLASQKHPSQILPLVFDSLFSEESISHHLERLSLLNANDSSTLIEHDFGIVSSHFDGLSGEFNVSKLGSGCGCIVIRHRGYHRDDDTSHGHGIVQSYISDYEIETGRWQGGSYETFEQQYRATVWEKFKGDIPVAVLDTDTTPLITSDTIQLQEGDVIILGSGGVFDCLDLFQLASTSSHLFEVFTDKSNSPFFQTLETEFQSHDAYDTHGPFSNQNWLFWSYFASNLPQLIFALIDQGGGMGMKDVTNTAIAMDHFPFECSNAEQALEFVRENPEMEEWRRDDEVSDSEDMTLWVSAVVEERVRFEGMEWEEIREVIQRENEEERVSSMFVMSDFQKN